MPKQKRAVTELASSAALTLDALKNHLRVSDERLGKAAGGYTHDQVSERRRGITPLDLNDLERFATAFDCPPTVFLMEPAEAIRYALDHQEFGRSIMISDFAALAA